MTTGETGRVREALESSRRELLDLTLRNPLLNHRLTGARGARIVDERSAEVFRILAVEGKALRFLPAAERTVAETPPGQGDEPDPRHTDRKLRTSHTPDRLQSRLLRTAHDARTLLEEQGVNVLHLALGMLHWRDVASPEQERVAPLLLVPVALSRRSAVSAFELERTQEEPGGNLSLREKLRVDHGLDLPMPDEDVDVEELDVRAYLAACAQAVAQVPGWRVEPDEMALGFFSFGKLLMYRDLEGEGWPESGRPWDHPILRDLYLGGLRSVGAVAAPTGPDNPHEVVDADGSQQRALATVAASAEVTVIQGPPGTGKSQTITNLVAAAVARGESVLFVAEKMAALEVVKRRLDAVGLGPCCLELHSHKSSRRQVAEELDRTLSAGRPRLQEDPAHAAQLAESAARLSAHTAAVNTPIGDTGVTPHHAVGEALRSFREHGELPALTAPVLGTMAAEEFARAREVVRALEARLEEVVDPKAHVFWGAGLTRLLPADRAGIESATREAREAIDGVLAAAERTAQALGVEAARDEEGITRQHRAMELLALRPKLCGVDVSSPAWRIGLDEILRLLEVGAKHADLLARHRGVLSPEGWTVDAAALRAELAPWADRWWRFLSGRYRAAAKRFASLCVGSPPSEVTKRLALLDVVVEEQGLRRALEEGADLLGMCFGGQAPTPESDWDALRRAARWAGDLHAMVAAGHLPSETLEAAARIDSDTARGLAEAAESAFAVRAQRLEALDDALAWRRDRAAPLCELPIDTALERLGAWAERAGSLHEMAAFNQEAQRVGELGLDAVADLAVSWPRAATHLGFALESARHVAVLDRAFDERPELGEFDRAEIERCAARFAELDRAQFLANRARIARAHWERMPGPVAAGQVGVLRHQLRLKRRHMPIRRLLAMAGRAVQSVKPVFMMGPLSVAKYLAPEGPRFDLVVFDEASQVRPVDAFGSILRARRLVVVGDSRQLPPTNFFDRMLGGEESDEEDAAAVTRDVESVLALCEARGARSQMLRWHYRSRHPSLIAVSNHVFYGDRLLVFPSPEGPPAQGRCGLTLRRLRDAVYERGAARNEGEAAAVAEAVLHHAATNPGLTLGVAAFSVAQMRAVEEALERARRESPDTEAFFRAHPHEPFFVKNLENVQGDERDVILISVGYGRDAEGRVHMNFGPLNQAGGERRLNVLVTRARERCEVFTNMTADDLDPARSDAPGVEALRTFLAFAESGLLPRAAGAEDSAPPAFEEEVRRALADLGHGVVVPPGGERSHVDVAVADPAGDGRLVIGISTDAASGDEAATVRDHHRLRPQVLGGLGWRLHRAWCADWFRDPRGAIERLDAAVNAARGQSVPRAATHEPGAIARDADAPPPGLPPVPAYAVARSAIDLEGQALGSISAAAAARWVVDVVAVEGPVHEDEVIARIRDLAGCAQAGNRVRENLLLSMAAAEKAGAISRRGPFLWPAGMGRAPLRDRSELQPSSRRVEAICPEEMEEAVLRAVRESFGISADELPATARIPLGFRRTSEGMEAALLAAAQRLVERGALESVGGQFRIPVTA